jgi:cell division septation protein DedD
MPLEERPAEPLGAAADESLEDLKLKELISDIEGTVEKSIGTEEKITEAKEAEFRFDLEKALTEDIFAKPESAAPAVPAGATVSDYEKTRAVMEQTLAALDLPPAPPEAVSPKPPSKNLAAVLILVLVVGAGVAAGYIFSAKEPQTVPQAVPAKKISSPAPGSATPPAMAKPLVPQTNEMPATVESKPSALPVPSAAEPVKEPAAAETVHPVQQEPALPAAEPIKTASEQPPAAVPVSPPAEPVKEPAAAETVHPVQQEPAPPAAEPIKTISEQPPVAAPVSSPAEPVKEPAAELVTPPAKPPAAEQKNAEPPQKALEQPKMTKAAVAGFYCVNVGSFKLQDSTERVCRDLRNKGYEPIAETVTLSDGNTWFRVTVGNFETRDEAAQFGRELESKTNIKPMVVKRKH